MCYINNQNCPKEIKNARKSASKINYLINNFASKSR